MRCEEKAFEKEEAYNETLSEDSGSLVSQPILTEVQLGDPFIDLFNT